MPGALNQVELEISVLSRQCLNRRLPSVEILREELRAWEQQRNRQKAKVNWRFTAPKAREKMGRLYPPINLS